MYKNFRKYSFAKTMMWGIATSFVFSQCSQKPTDTFAEVSDAAASIRVLIVGGGESHDFDTWFKGADSETLERDGFASVNYISDMDSILHYLPGVDVLYLTNNQPINDPNARQAIVEFAEAGKGMVLGHAALWYNWADWPEYNQNIVSGGSRGHDKYGEFEVSITNANHPVTQGVDQKFSLKDELYYYKIDENGPGIEILAEATSDQSGPFPSVFVVKHPNTKIVGIALGHDGESHDLEAYQALLRNSVKWVSE
ncbi:MAG TPA: ThuA domain-containing protein [Cyclobacteriaceae bacterium]|nr:ThuA domain-containing protein [Cyclobacteriaceae bacterium]